jgi:CheY-like chemotaxis protein
MEANNGQEGLQILLSKQHDLVITDLVMPVMNGFELLENIRNSQELKDTRVIVSSASGSPSHQQRALTQGSNGFLTKPIDENNLFQIISTHLRLEWVYESSKKRVIATTPLRTELVLPSRETLEILFSHAQQANLKALKSYIEQLMDTHQQYQSFAEIILKLAKQFKVEEIEDFLQQHLANMKST